MGAKTKAVKPAGKGQTKGTMSSAQKRELALDLYLNTDLEQKAICEIVGWAEKTFTDNKQERGWEEMKKATSVTSERIIRNLYARAFELSEANGPDGKPQKLDADKLVKIANSIEKLSNRKVTLSQFINVFKAFTQFALIRDPELAKRINTLQQEFITQKVNS